MGTDGPDVLYDTSGNDTIDGGAGDDRIIVTGGTDTVDGGEGEDYLIIDAGQSPGGVSMSAPTLGSQGHSGSASWGGNSVAFQRIEGFVIISAPGSFADNVTTGSGNDAFIHYGLNDLFYLLDFVDLGAGTKDRIVADFSQVVSYSVATHLIDAASNRYYISVGGNGKLDYRNAEQLHFTGGAQADDITGLPGNDMLDGGAGNDILRGGDGDDYLDGGAGNDTMNGEGGDDTIVVKEGSDAAHGGAGTDTLVLDLETATNDVIDNPAPQPDGENGFEGALYDYTTGSRITYTGIDRFVITTGSGNDTITGASGDDIISTGAGNDFVNVGSGIDQADGGAGQDGISADMREATVAILWDLQANTYSGQGSFANFEYFGTVRTGSGNDVIVTTGLLRNEIIRTGAGDDTITVAGGSDTVHAGAGFDTLIVDLGSATNDVIDNPAPQPDEENGGFQGAYYDYTTGSRIDYSSVERFIVTTGSGNDTITGASGDDIISTGAGNDFVNVRTGLDQADGGAGEDGISADMRTATAAILWNLQANTYSGPGSFANFEYFGTVHTGSGNDVVVTTSLQRREIIHTGAGDDTITVAGGSDTVHGGSGFDTLIVNLGSATNEVIDNPAPQPDDANGGFQGAIYDYTTGNRIDYTGIERFVVTTGSGNDTITGADGNDIISTGAGNDFVNVRTGVDEADGGAGEDGISADMRTATTAISWNLQANTYSGPGSFTNFEYLGTLYTGSGNDVIVTTSMQRNETIFAGDGNDTITVAGGSDIVHGGLGSDILVIDWSAATNGVVDNPAPTPDEVNGGFKGSYYDYTTGATIVFTGIERLVIDTGSGNDSITGAAGDDIIRLGAGNDFGRGGEGNDTLYGGAGSDTLLGEGGDDTLVYDGLGDDPVYGGSGTDTLVVDFSNATASIVDNPNAGTFGFDASYWDQGANSVAFTSIERILITTGAFDDRITTYDGNDEIRTGGGNDVLNAGAGNDLLDGGSGADTMRGGTGNDLYIVDSLDDVVEEQIGEGNDSVRTAIGSKTDFTKLYVLPANVEFLYGTSTTGQGVRGNSLNNSIFMGDGADLIVADDGGDDFIFAGGGNDFIYYGGAFSVADYTDGGAGTDTIGLLGTYILALAEHSLISVERLALYSGIQNGVGTANSYTITTADANVAAGGELFITAASLKANETFTFNGIAETNGRFTILSGAGNDIIAGGGGDDYIHGGAGADQLFGLGGRDTLIGGAGADTLRGGLGGDVFTYQNVSQSAPGARDRILDFQNGSDRIDLSAIDAIAATPENDAFTFIGSGPFTAQAGQLRVFQENDYWVVAGDVDGDGHADIEIRVDMIGPQPLPLIGADFIL